MNNYISLSKLLDSVGGVINSTFSHPFWLKAEVLSAREHNGNCYIELIETTKDGVEVCKHSAVAFRSAYSLIKDKIRSTMGSNGLPVGSNVLMLAKISFNSKFGLQIIVSDIDTSFTLGEMEKKITEMRAALKDKGLYELNKQIAAPLEFTKIAVISPKNAAGLGDFKIEADILAKNGLCDFDYYSAKFEGDGVESSIVSAFVEVHERHSDYDAVVFIRGGGSKSSLNQLNEFKIAACICKFPIPVFCGVGHERDKILADEIANIKFDTPSKVVEYISNTIFNNALNANELIYGSNLLIANLLEKEQSNIEKMSLSIKSSATALVNALELAVGDIKYDFNSKLTESLTSNSHALQNMFSEIGARIDLKVRSLEMWIQNTNEEVKNLLDVNIKHWKEQLSSSYRETISLSPLSTLDRGYTYTTINGVNVNSEPKIVEGSEMVTRSKNNTIKSTVTEVKPNE